MKKKYIKNYIYTCIFLLAFHTAYTQDYETYVKQALTLEQQTKEIDALYMYKQALSVKPTDTQALLKCGQLYLIIGTAYAHNIGTLRYYCDSSKCI